MSPPCISTGGLKNETGCFISAWISRTQPHKTYFIYEVVYQKIMMKYICLQLFVVQNVL